MIAREPRSASNLCGLRLALRDRASQAGVLLYPAIERCGFDQEQLPARHHLHKRLYVALEVGDAHSQRCGRLGSRKQAPRHGVDRSLTPTSRHG